MDLGDVLQDVRRVWWALPGGILLGLAVAAAVVSSATPVYASSAQLFVSMRGWPDTDAAYQADLYSQRRAASYAQAIESEQLAAEVAEELGLDTPASELAARVTAVVPRDTAIVTVTVTDSSAPRARDVADALSRAFTRWVAEVEASAEQDGPVAGVTTIQAATLDPAPVSPDTARDLGLGGALGFLLGLAVAVWHGRAGRAVDDPDDVLGRTGHPVVGVIPDAPPLVVSRLPGRDDEASPAAEALRVLCANLHLLAGGRAPGVIVVTDAAPGAGASPLAFHLGRTLAATGARVTLVDADTDSPHLTRALGLEDAEGLEDLLSGAVTSVEAVRRPLEGGLSFVPVGGQQATADGRPRSPDLRTVLEGLRARQDHVVIDTPPLTGSADARVLVASADVGLVTARFGRTGHDRLTDAVEALSRGAATPCGVVLTRVPRAVTTRLAGSHRYEADADRGGVVAVGWPRVGPRT
ncbi:Wzz/FepE/Etk N-terminal domain-containing protein [Geodermatophilus sp. SYSU D00758]